MEQDRRWMYDRNNPNREELKEEFVEGVKGFIAYAKTLPEFCDEGTIRCPCAKCKCIKLLIPGDVKVHLYKKEFRENYYVWTVHEENYSNLTDVDFQNLTGCESSTFFEKNYDNSQMHEMVLNAFGIHPRVQSQQNVDESPNDEAKHFYELLEAASRPLYKDSKLSVAVRLLTIKSDWNISQAAMNAIIGLMREVSLNINLPGDYYKAKKLVSKLGLSSTKIDCCEKGCMLYYKDDAALEACKFCGLSRFKKVTNAKARKFQLRGCIIYLLYLG
uniref:Uncharacterized protein LOC104221384 n=1 Tax=Nicotiana sylvestris TaxID=4096 RepID=A0A1U7W0M2_NICSY|nr:PREDICTED: uncharacterized protein LOC104221384 [Nicotiana sylvestris]